MKAAVIPQDVIQKGIESWSSAVVYYSLGTKLGVIGMKRYVESHWKIKGTVDIVPKPNGVLCFALEEDRARVLNKGPWFLNGQILITRKWERGIDLRRDLLQSIPIWIKLILPTHLWTTEAMGRCASVVGIPFCVDSATAARPGSQFA